MQRQKHQSEFLRAMGVDIYVQRPASDPTVEADGYEAAIGHEDGGAEPVSIESGEKSKKSPIKPEDLLESKAKIEEKPKQEVDPKFSEEEASDPEVSMEPLYFLWQQTDSSLMLSVQLNQPTDLHTRLLQAVAQSLNPSKLQGGSGKWPLSDAQKTTETETQQFLSSFVQGRSEQTGADLRLILFGEDSVAQFSALEGEYQQLVGKVLPGDGKISEFRVVPSLADMLEEPKVKSVTWRSIRNLTGS